jgi:hypothetical protein
LRPVRVPEITEASGEAFVLRSLFRWFVVVVLLLAVGAGFLRDSAYWSFVELHHGLRQRDLARVERVVDLEQFAASSTRALGAVVADEAGLRGNDAASAALNALVGVVARGVGEVVKGGAAELLRKAIKDGSFERRIGPFVVDEGVAALGAVYNLPEGALVELKGTCRGAPATLALSLTRHDDGPFGGHPRRYVVTGVDEASAKKLAAQCRAGHGDGGAGGAAR